MGERTSYTPGTFSWVDLSTTDQEAAKSFYGQLFGWEAADHPVGEGMTYSMMSLDGRNVAAISTQPEQQREAGAPPAWNSYITVADVDQTLARVGQLGGTVHADAFDVFEFGRMGVAQDPHGAYFLLWRANQHIGAALVNAPGALCWNELSTPDMEAAASFYGELLGWVVEPLAGSEAAYMTIKTADGHADGGIRPTGSESEPAHWLVYFGIDEVEPGLARVVELGGSALMGPQSVGPGQLAIVQDPQGATFALYSGHFDE